MDENAGDTEIKTRILKCSRVNCDATLQVTSTGFIRLACTNCECSLNKRIFLGADDQLIAVYCTNCDDCDE